MDTMQDWNVYRDMLLRRVGEIAEALGVAIALNAGAALTCSARVLDAVEALPSD